MLHARHSWFPGIVCAGFACLLSFGGNPAWGQRVLIQPVPFNRPSTFAEQPENAPTFVTNREMFQRLRTAKQRIIEEDYQTGVKYLQSLLDEREDWFIEQPNDKPAANLPNESAREALDFVPKHYISLKNATEELVGRLPAPARQIYERDYGIPAKLLLKEAIAAGSTEQLSEIARRYFHTEAGYEAVYRLGLLKADHGEPFAAALHFQRLKSSPKIAARFEPLLSLKLALSWEQAGLREQSLTVLKQLARETPNGQLRLGQRTVALFREDQEASSWLAKTLSDHSASSRADLEQWPVFRGNASRSAISSETAPLGPVDWSLSTIQEESAFGLSRGQLTRIEKELDKLAETRAADERTLPLPVAQPLVANNRAIFRTLQSIQAVNLSTGETLWKTAEPNSLLRPVLAHVSSNAEELVLGNRAFPGRGNSQQKSALETYLTQRIWRDMTFGTLSCDQQRVYSIEDVGFADGLNFAMPNQNDPFIPKMHNKLMAFGLKNGRAEWEAGGPQLSKDESLGGTFFLGPPLPIGEQLFCLGERNNEISLLVIDAANGKLQWEQRLVSPSLNLFANRERRTTGLCPTFGQGVMVCPTASGAVVAVDVSRRILLWAYQYESTQTEDTMVANMAWQRAGNVEFAHESLHPESRWADTVPVVAEGRVLITPSDSEEFHCLDLSTGELQWIAPRGQGVYLAGVDQGRVIIVGRSQVRAYRLQDGQDLWSTPVTIPRPAGRGILTAGRLHLPFNTGEVGTIDLKQGRIIARSQFPEGQPAGNLIAAGGRVLTQSLGSIAAFPDRELLLAEIRQKLTTNPQDAEALAQRGVLLLHQGQSAEGIADLRQAWKIDAQEDTRVRLVRILLDELRNKTLPASVDRKELRQLLRSSEESLQFLMLSGSSVATAEERSEAFRDYLKLMRTLGLSKDLQTIAESHHVRGDCWVKARMHQLSALASPEEHQEWNRILTEELPTILADYSANSQWQILESLPPLPAVEAAAFDLLPKFTGEQALLQKTLMLESLQQSDRLETRQQAALLLAESYLKTGRESEAVPLIQSLGEKWPEAWRENFQGLKAAVTPIWPAGKVEAIFQKRQVAVLPEISVGIESARNSPYENWSFSIDQQSRRLVARNENGSLEWNFDLSEVNQPIYELDEVRMLLRGHLAVLSFKSGFAVLDLMSRNHSAEVLWSQALMDGEIDVDEMFRLQQQLQRQQLFGGGPPMLGLHFGWVAIPGEQSIVFQVGERLAAADALTGKLRWERKNLRPQSRVYGDKDTLAAVSPDGKSALLIRAADGEILNVINLPDPQTQIGFQGTHLVGWLQADGQQVLQSQNLATKDILWKIACPAGTKHQKVNLDDLALYQPDGKLLLVSLENGAIKFQTTWDPKDASPADYRILELEHCYVLLLGLEDPALKKRSPFASAANTQIVNGPVVAFDRKTGKELWKTDIKNQLLEQLPPYHSPILVLNKRWLPGGFAGFGANSFHVQILNLISGEMIYEQNQLPNISPLSIRLKPAEQRATVMFYEGAIEIKFTKEPDESSRS